MPASSSLKSRLAQRLPRSWVDAYRWYRQAIPAPASDWTADLADLVRPRAERLPPAGLRRQVGIGATRAEYADSGRGAARQIRTALAGLLPPGRGRWLDFGCGCGRIARHLVRDPACASLTGVDIDLDSIRWCERHLQGSFLAVQPQPPLPLSDESFDLAIASSIFTHFDEREQETWLREIHRLLKPGGLFVASTHGEALHVQCTELSQEDVERLRETGFAFAPRRGHFNTAAAYHARSYVENSWGRVFELARWIDRGLFDIHDLSVWRRRKE